MRILFLLLMLLPLPVQAGQAEAKDLARNYNCKVTGISEQMAETGANLATTYKVSCLVSATASEEDKKTNGTLWVRCESALCSLLKKGE
jgi:hypothetical protein